MRFILHPGIDYTRSVSHAFVLGMKIDSRNNRDKSNFKLPSIRIPQQMVDEVGTRKKKCLDFEFKSKLEPQPYSSNQKFKNNNNQKRMLLYTKV